MDGNYPWSAYSAWHMGIESLLLQAVHEAKHILRAGAQPVDTPGGQRPPECGEVRLVQQEVWLMSVGSCTLQRVHYNCVCRVQVRDQLTHLEDNVPWNAVKSAWRNRRPSWRRQLKAADSIAEVAARMEEFRQHLANDGPALVV